MTPQECEKMMDELSKVADKFPNATPAEVAFCLHHLAWYYHKRYDIETMVRR